MPVRVRHPAVHRVSAAAALGAVLLLGAACTSHDAMPEMSSSSASSAPSGASTAFNDADVTFAQQMTPHHRQAVAMSDLVLAKSGVDPEVTALAQQIKQAQEPEIATMAAWLSAWGRPSDNEMGGMDRDSDGMMSAEDLDALAAADGPTGQRLYLDGMVRHHKGAVTMARTEVDAGQDPDAVALAQQIVTSQQTEIATMEKILDRL